MANLLLATLKAPPPRGSLRESVLALLMIRREENDVAKTRVLIQTLVKQDSGPDAWNEYFKSVFPWVETAKTQEKQDWIKKLNEEVAKGPLVITAKHEVSFRSRLKARVIQKQPNQDPGPPLPRLKTKMAPAIPR